MLSLLADENFDGRIVRGLRRAVSGLDLLRVQDTDLAGADDEILLSWAASHGRVILTHDLSTLVGLAHRRTESSLPMAGVIAVAQRAPTALVIDDIRLIVLAMAMEELAGHVLYVPLQS